MKKVLIVLGCIVVVCAAGMFIFRLKIQGMLKFYREYSVKTVDFKTIPDGVYRGNCKVFVVGADVEAKVQDHRVSDIKIIKQQCGGKKYEGREVIDRVLKDQTLGVDAVTGSTASSKCILIALERAFSAVPVK
jgi:uncharacterized protein with FMN-binding domain